MNILTKIIFTYLIFFGSNLFSQKSSIEIEKLNKKELKVYIENINSSYDSIFKINKNQKDSLNSLNTEKKVFLKDIENLKKEINLFNDSIKEQKGTITKNNKVIDSLSKILNKDKTESLTTFTDKLAINPKREYSTSKELKTYKGIYKNGNAEYQYYENDDYERVLNGSYKFSTNVNEYGGYRIFSEKGFFKDGKKDGEWIFSIESFYGSTKNNALTIKGKFVNNLKSGSWEQISNNYGSLNLSFLNDTIVGKIKRNNTSTTIEANFDSSGKWDGEFKLIANDLEAIAIFKNNILVKNIMKRPSTGEILSRYSPDFDLTNFEESIKNYKIVPFIYYGQSDYRNNKENLGHLAGVSSLSDKQMDYLIKVESSLNYFMEEILQLYWPHRKIGCEIYLPEFKGLNELLIIKNPDILITK